MKGLQLIEQQIQPDWKVYRASIDELTSLYQSTSNRINHARLLGLMWMRAHQKMASGVQSPAEWFDISDLPSQAVKLGLGAIF